MKKYSILLFLLIVLVIKLSAHVQLNNPEGGETFTAGQEITIEWEELVSHDTQNWDLYFSNDAGETWELIEENIPLDTLTYVWEVPNIETSMAQIRVVQDNVGANYSDASENFTISATTGINESTEQDKLIIYPNPVVNRFTIEFDNPENQNLSFLLYSIDGKLVKTVFNKRTSELSVDRKDLPSGIYIYQLKTNSGLYSTGKIIFR